MLFNSLDFLVFFPLAVALYFAAPVRWRWAVLLTASYGFYAYWKAEYLALLIASTLVDYLAALAMGRRATRSERRPFLLLSLTSNLGLLVGFKYLGFFGASAHALFGATGLPYEVPVLDVLLPVGISFYTFQTLAYSIDVYRGHVEPERHLGHFALYVSFFPQLVAGPIERSRRLLPQFRQHHAFDAAGAADGLKLMVWGLFLKVVVADRLAPFVEAVYGDPGAFTGGAVVLATYLFAIQVYCDFAGYSLIAVGAAEVMGFRLSRNFRQPFLAASMDEFWRRWHVTLTTWFRDYVYAPLRGRDRAASSRHGALLAVFVLTGLWHGASWTMVLWGTYYGLLIVAGAATAPWRDRVWALLERRAETRLTVRAAGVVISPAQLRRPLAVLTTFHLFVLGGFLFGAGTLTDAATLLASVTAPGGGVHELLTTVYLGRYEFTIALVVIALVLFVDTVERREDIRSFVARQPVWVRWTAYVGLVLSILMLGQFSAEPFVYFQF